MARQTALPHSLPPLGVSREAAAAYLSLSATKFSELVDLRVMPRPKRIGARLVWDLEEVRTAFKAMPEDDPVDTTWDDVDAP